MQKIPARYFPIFIAFEGVADKCEDCRNLADRAQNVCKACVAASYCADIELALCPDFCDDDSRINASQKIGDYRCEQVAPPVVCQIEKR